MNVPQFFPATVKNATSTKSGLMSAADKARLDALQVSAEYVSMAALKASSVPTSDKPKIVFLQSRSAWFAWDSVSTLTGNDLDCVVLTANGSDPGRYIRLSVTHRKHQLTTTWYIDPTSGDDENTGSASNSALKTCRELNLRLSNVISLSCTIYVLNNLSSTDPLTLTAFTSTDYVANGSSSTVTLAIEGTRTSVRTGTISAVTTPVTATNTPGSITDSGATWATSISNKYMIVLTSGASSSRILWPCKDLGSNAVRVNNPVNEATGAATTFPSANDTYTEYSLTTGLINISTNAIVTVKNWYQPTTTTGFITTQQSAGFFTSAFGNLQAIYSNGINVIASRDGNTSASQPILSNRVQFAGCTLLQSNITARTMCTISFTTSLLQGVKMFGGGTTNVPGGQFSIQNTGIMDVSGSAIDLNRGSYCRIGTTTWGANNTTGVSVLTGSQVCVDSGITPTLTGTTEISIDATANLLGNLEQYSAGANFPTVAACNTWATWAAAPFNRLAICFKSLARIFTA